jgi:hypothetical protein
MAGAQLKHRDFTFFIIGIREEFLSSFGLAEGFRFIAFADVFLDDCIPNPPHDFLVP